LLEGKTPQANRLLDLGIDVDKIKLKFVSVLTQRGIKENADYDDMAGPLIVCVIFGILLLFVSTALISPSV